MGKDNNYKPDGYNSELKTEQKRDVLFFLLSIKVSPDTNHHLRKFVEYEIQRMISSNGI